MQLQDLLEYFRLHVALLVAIDLDQQLFDLLLGLITLLLVEHLFDWSCLCVHLHPESAFFIINLKS